jgi:hypothetical protein
MISNQRKQFVALINGNPRGEVVVSNLIKISPTSSIIKTQQ